MTKIDPDAPVTRGLLDEAVDVILNGMDKVVGELRNQINTRFEKMESHLNGLEVEVREVKDDVRGLKASFLLLQHAANFRSSKPGLINTIH